MTVLLFKKKDGLWECREEQGISLLLLVWKMYARALMECVMESTELELGVELCSVIKVRLNVCYNTNMQENK